MKVLVCGSRHFDNVELFRRVLDRIPGISEIIEGGARGADTLARTWGEVCDIPVRTFPADWDKHGKAAGTFRNKQMLDEGKPDLVVAFLAPTSRGTKNMIEQASKAGIEVRIINVD